MATPSSNSGTSGVDEIELDRVGQLLDLVTYVALMVVVFGGVSAVATLAVGGRAAPGVKFGLFVWGWLAFLVGTLMLRPQSAWRDDDDDGLAAVEGEGLLDHDDEEVEESDFQRFVQQLPPARFRPVPPQARLPTGARIFVASLCMLAVSLVLEQAFGVGP